MKIFNPHFWYNKSQRNGVFFLVVIILILQSIIIFDVFSKNEIIETNTTDVVAFQNQIDSLQRIELEKRVPKIIPFNPNYITDYKGEQLGMSLEEIDRLLAFRRTNKFVNSANEFQQVTKVSDTLLYEISPYFKFPDWVVKQNNQSLKSSNISSSSTGLNKKEAISTTDINKATEEDFKSIKGIGDKLSERIVKYRTKIQGFSFEDQLAEVWGLDEEVVAKTLAVFKILEKPTITKVNVNTIEFKELLKNPYIDYDLCVKIFNYRDEVAELQTISELKNISGFPLDKYERIVLYLMAK